MTPEKRYKEFQDWMATSHPEVEFTPAQWQIIQQVFLNTRLMILHPIQFTRQSFLTLLQEFDSGN